MSRIWADKINSNKNKAFFALLNNFLAAPGSGRWGAWEPVEQSQAIYRKVAVNFRFSLKWWGDQSVSPTPDSVLERNISFTTIFSFIFVWTGWKNFNSSQAHICLTSACDKLDENPSDVSVWTESFDNWSWAARTDKK